VYVSLRTTPQSAEGLAAPARARRWSGVGRNVFLLGFVSLFTDISQEMVMAVLPLYLTLQLGLGPLAFGVMDGVYQGATAIVRLLGGVFADRRGRHKEVAGFGYALSAFCKLGLVAAGSAWAAISAVLVLDRLGKGVRTPPRDALISLSSEPATLGRAFGVHRALDTTGALIGPLLGFVLLAQRPGAYTGVFLTSFAIALIGLGILFLFVDGTRDTAPAPAPAPEPVPSLAASLRLLADRRLRACTIAGSALGLFTISDAFVYLLIQHQTDMPVRWFPLLFLGTAVAYLVLALPLGVLADKIGRGRVFVAGYAPLLAVYILLVSVHMTTPLVLLCLALLGSYYAATDGVLMALASGFLSDALRTTGLAIVSTATATARFAASVAFGGAWVLWGPHRSVIVFLVGLVVAILFAAGLTRRVAP
jgi:MFS family permease